MSEKKQRQLVRPDPMVERVVSFIDQRVPFPIGSTLLSIVCGFYLANPTAGVFELIPDVVPYIGNLDEAAAGVLLAWCIGNLARWWRLKRAQRKASRERSTGE